MWAVEEIRRVGYKEIRRDCCVLNVRHLLWAPVCEHMVHSWKHCLEGCGTFRRWRRWVTRSRFYGPASLLYFSSSCWRCSGSIQFSTILNKAAINMNIQIPLPGMEFYEYMARNEIGGSYDNLISQFFENPTKKWLYWLVLQAPLSKIPLSPDPLRHCYHICWHQPSDWS